MRVPGLEHLPRLMSGWSRQGSCQLMLMLRWSRRTLTHTPLLWSLMTPRQSWCWSISHQMVKGIQFQWERERKGCVSHLNWFYRDLKSSCRARILSRNSVFLVLLTQRALSICSSDGTPSPTHAPVVVVGVIGSLDKLNTHSWFQPSFLNIL